MFIVKAGPPEAEIVSLAAAHTFLRTGLSPGDDVPSDELINSLIGAAREYAETYTGKSLAKKPYVQVHDAFPYYIDTIQSRDAYPPSYYSAPRYSSTLWNYGQQIKLLYPPLISVEKITYVKTDGSDHELMSGTDFQVDPVSECARVFPLPGGTWPACLYCANAVRIFFTSGYEVQSTEEPPGEVDSASVSEPETLEVSNIPATNQVGSYTIDRTVPNKVVLFIKQLVTLWWQNRDAVIAQAGAGGKFAPLPHHLESLLDSERVIDFAPTRG